MDIWLFWIGIGIAFLIVELITATFYGFSLAIASFCVAIYAYIFGVQNIDSIQALIFLVISVICSIFLPKILTNSIKENPVQGLDIYIGTKHRIKQSGEDFIVMLDGVRYLVVSDEELENRDFVKITQRKGSIFVVEKNKK